MAGVVRVDQDYDLTLRYGQAFRTKLIFGSFGTEFPKHKLHHAINSQATRVDIDQILTKNSILYVSCMGHGIYDAFTGHQGCYVWTAGENLSSLKGKIVHLLSCQTGALLGQAMVKHGAIGFWGYTVEFGISHQDPEPTTLDQDALAEIFLKMDAIIDRGILSSKSPSDIYNSITKYVAQAVQLLYDPADRALLIDSYVHLVCPATNWGDPAAVL